MENRNENCIEWIRDNKRATVTLSQRSMITRIRKLAESNPEECQIVAENQDGSIVAHVPTKWVKISPTKKLSDKQLENARKQMKKLHGKKAEYLA